MNVYVLTNGTYSDYGIVAIYRDRETAERALAVIEGPNGEGGDGADIQEMQLHDDIDLGSQVTYYVPCKRRSGEPTVVQTWSPSGYREAEPTSERALSLSGRGKRRVWIYSGTDRAAVLACARAQSHAVHGNVVETTEWADARRLIDG